MSHDLSSGAPDAAPTPANPAPEGAAAAVPAAATEPPDPGMALALLLGEDIIPCVDDEPWTAIVPVEEIAAAPAEPVFVTIGAIRIPLRLLDWKPDSAG